MDWIDEENRKEWRDIGWKRDKAPVCSIRSLTRRRSRLQTWWSDSTVRCLLISFVPCFLSTSFYARWISILVWWLKVKQLKFPPPICIHRPVLFQIFGLKRCVPIGAGLGYCCHCVRAWPTQLEINMGKERKRKADRQKYSYAKAPFEESKICENIGVDFKQRLSWTRVLFLVLAN